MQGLMNMADRIEQTNIFSWVILAEYIALHYHKEAQCFSSWQMWGIFLDFCARIAAVENIRGAYVKFPDFFVWALLLIVNTWNSSLLRSNHLQLQCTCCTIPTTSERPPGIVLCEHVNDLRHSLFHLNCLIMTASELRE